MDDQEGFAADAGGEAVRRDHAIVAGLVIALAIGCGGELQSAKSTVGALADEVSRYEEELVKHCGDIELDIIHNTPPGPDRDLQIALINGKCIRAYDAFNKWDEDYRAFAAAVEAAEKDNSKLQAVFALLVQVVRSEREFIDAVLEVTSALGGEQN